MHLQVSANDLSGEIFFICQGRVLQCRYLILMFLSAAKLRRIIGFMKTGFYDSTFSVV